MSNNLMDNIQSFTGVNQTGEVDYETMRRFTSKSVRNSFVKKVLGIVSAQLLLTIAIVTFLLSSKATIKFIEDPIIYYSNAIMTVVCLCAITCSDMFRRQVPFNYFALLTFTVTSSISLASTITQFSLGNVILAIPITLCVCLGLFIFSMTSKTDFTRGRFWAFIFILEVANFFLFFIMGNFPLYKIMVGIGASALFAMYMVHDLQMLMEGKSRSIEIDDYVFGALAIYLDIINIFIEILKILEAISKDKDKDE